MNDRAKQILIAVIASRLIPWVKTVFGIVLTLDQVCDLFALAVIVWHTGAATMCVIVNHFFPWLTLPKDTPPSAAKVNP